ncbi:hypothetical protein [Saccharopolyspora sp. ASAGF58]|uniref:hypothetical protein n=1 Tax=Saccharopolyspora TaxID=1835 RepID=UPI00143FDC75|nr:hypothetical protein [Saccharopolyspora sp. ASAGF58]QIZ35364.1 hypothetical protein FDZ84_12410 [Saccharopolyspora sp. ASAGF58]
MFRRAILRWPNGSDWGHLATVSDDGGLPQFAGFVQMSDPRVQDLLARIAPRPAGGDMWEAHFTTNDSESAAELIAA